MLKGRVEGFQQCLPQTSGHGNQNAFTSPHPVIVEEKDPRIRFATKKLNHHLETTRIKPQLFGCSCVGVTFITCKIEPWNFFRGVVGVASRRMPRTYKQIRHPELGNRHARSLNMVDRQIFLPHP